MYNDYIPLKAEDVEPDAMYSFNADSKDGIPSLLHDIAYANKKELNGVKTENWHASISGEDLQKLYPKNESPILTEQPKTENKTEELQTNNTKENATKEVKQQASVQGEREEGNPSGEKTIPSGSNSVQREEASQQEEVTTDTTKPVSKESVENLTKAETEFKEANEKVGLKAKEKALDKFINSNFESIVSQLMLNNTIKRKC